MKEQILENKKLIVIVIIAILLIVGISAFFLLRDNDGKEEKDVEVEDVENVSNYSDEIMEALDNIENLDSFITTSTFTTVSNDPEMVHDYTSVSVGKYDLKNQLAYIKVDETMNGADSVREYYNKVEDNMSKRYNYIQGEWTYEENQPDPTFYNVNFIREQLDYASYTANKEDDKIIVIASYTTETMLNQDIAEYLNQEATYSYEFIFEGGYLIEYTINVESSDYTEKTEGVFTNFNEEMNIVIPNKALEIE